MDKWTEQDLNPRLGGDLSYPYIPSFFFAAHQAKGSMWSCQKLWGAVLGGYCCARAPQAARALGR
ncbi:MAG: hypothetical protein QXD70_00895 [Candidatus Bathyarchaeia archaeon]